jgi:hypothetical protein
MAAAVTSVRCTDTSTRPSFPRNHSWMPDKATTVDETCLERKISALRRIAITLDFIMQQVSSPSVCCARAQERDSTLSRQQEQSFTSCLRSAGSSHPHRRRQWSAMTPRPAPPRRYAARFRSAVQRIRHAGAGRPLRPRGEAGKVSRRRWAPGRGRPSD